MKNIFIGIALATLTMACTSEQKASFEDASTPNIECTTEGCEKACCLEDATSECSGEKAAACSAEKAAECSSEKAEKKVCPVTGQEIN